MGEGVGGRRAPLPARSSPAERRRGLSRLRPAGNGRLGRRAAAATPPEVAGPGRARGAAGCPWRGRAPGRFAVPGIAAARGDAPPRAGRWRQNPGPAGSRGKRSLSRGVEPRRLPRATFTAFQYVYLLRSRALLVIRPFFPLKFALSVSGPSHVYVLGVPGVLRRPGS